MGRRALPPPPGGWEKTIGDAIQRLKQGKPLNPQLLRQAKLRRLRIGPSTVAHEAGCPREDGSLVVEIDNLAGNKEHKPLGTFAGTTCAASRVEQLVCLKLFHLICARVDPTVPRNDYNFTR